MGSLIGSSSKSSTTYNIDESTHLLDESQQSSQAAQLGDYGLSAIASDVRLATSNTTNVVSNVIDAGAIAAASDAQSRSIAAQLDLGRAAISGIADAAGGVAGSALDRIAGVVSDALGFGGDTTAAAGDTVQNALGKVVDVVSGALDFGRDALASGKELIAQAMGGAAETARGSLALAADAKAPDAGNVRAQVYAMAGVVAAALVAVIFFGRGKR